VIPNAIVTPVTPVTPITPTTTTTTTTTSTTTPATTTEVIEISDEQTNTNSIPINNSTPSCTPVQNLLSCSLQPLVGSHPDLLTVIHNYNEQMAEYERLTKIAELKFDQANAVVMEKDAEIRNLQQQMVRFQKM
jgi:hypothetical protein